MIMGKLDFCLCGNKGADQLHSKHIFCSYTGQFMSDLVGNPEDLFSRATAQIVNGTCAFIMVLHHDNMSMLCMPPYTPLLHSETGVYRGIPIFLIFDPKHALLVLVRTALAMCTHNQCFEQNY